MSFIERATEEFNSQNIGVGYLINEAGEIYWQVGEWEGFNPAFVLQEWKKSGMNPIIIGNLKFTVIGKDDDKLVSTNVTGQGNLIGAKTQFYPGGYLICWTPSSIRPDFAYSIVKQLADLVRS